MKSTNTIDKSFYNQEGKEIQFIKFYEEQNHEKQVKDSLVKILNFNENEIHNIKRLGGRTNKTFKFSLKTGSDKNLENIKAKFNVKLNRVNSSNEKQSFKNNVEEEFVVRFPGNGTYEFIDRSNEKYNAEIAYGLGLDSETIYFNEDTGFKVCRYIKDGETLNKAEGSAPENIRLMAEGLRTLHCSREVFKSDFNPFKSIDIFEKALEKIIGQVPKEYKDVKAKCMALENRLKKLGLHRVPCHIDPLPENFIKVGKDKVYVIDWEYSGNYDGVWDLAAVSLEGDFTEAEEADLLKSYFKGIKVEKEKTLKEKITIYKIVQDMYWCTWAAAKAARGDDYLIEYSRFKFERVQGMLKEYEQQKEQFC